MSSTDSKMMKFAAKDTTESALTPERCHQLREGGIFELMVQLLHEHTIEPHNQSPADFNIDSFIKRFNQKAAKRKQLAQRIRTIVENTAKDDNELEILRLLEAVRAVVEKLYCFISDGSSHEIVNLPEMMEVVKFVADDNTRPIFELFGGVFVILDHLRAQARFYARFPELPSLGLACVTIQLICVVLRFRNRRDIKLLLLNGGRLYATLAGLIKEAFDHEEFVRMQCLSLIRIQEGLDSDEYHLEAQDPRPVFNQQYIRDYELTKGLAELAINKKNPETLSNVLEAIESYGILAMDHDHRNVLEFCSVDGSIGALIDVLVPSEEKDNDVENAQWYERQKLHSSIILHNINLFLLGQRIDPLLARQQQLAKEKLLAIYESRNIVETLVHHLKLADPNERSTDLDPITFIIGILGNVLKCSDDQCQKFLQIDDAIKTIKGFELNQPWVIEILQIDELKRSNVSKNWIIQLLRSWICLKNE